jgi:CRP/FNR family transcriptional regulator
VQLGEPILRCDTCAVRHHSVCGALTRNEIEQLNAIAHHKTFPTGHLILNDQEKAGYFANIISGVVKLTKTLSNGRQQVLGLLFASDFLGRPYRASSPYDAEAVTEVHLCTYDRTQFERLVREHPGLQQRLFEHVLDELDAAQEWMLLLGRKTAEEKVASFLVMVARRIEMARCIGAPAESAVRFELPITRAEIADYLGLTIETVSRQFTRLKAEKTIGLEGGRTVIILDRERLAQAAERSSD